VASFSSVSVALSFVACVVFLEHDPGGRGLLGLAYRWLFEPGLVLRSPALVLAGVMFSTDRTIRYLPILGFCSLIVPDEVTTVTSLFQLWHLS
jgi:hypothetical protein